MNCPQHIPQMLFAEGVAETTRSLEERIERLESKMQNFVPHVRLNTSA